MAGPAVRFSWEPYWQYQHRAWRSLNSWSCIAKLLILCLNVAKPFTLTEPGHISLRFAAQSSASVALVIVAATLWLMHARHQLYLEYRRALMLLHWASIAAMILVSFPVLVGARVASSSLVFRFVPLLFKSGGLAPLTAACFNRLPWQHVAVMASVFVALVSLVWSRGFCLIVSDTRDASLLSSIAAGLDFLCGNGEQLQQQAAAASSGEQRATPGVWQPTAHRIAAVCADTAIGRFFVGSGGSNGLAELAGSSSSSGAAAAAAAAPGSGADLERACAQLLLGQCQAVANTINIWFGVLLAVTLVVLVERHNKWQWLHRAAGGRRWLPDAPAGFKQANRRHFLQQQLLFATVLLDVPLLLLWVALARLYRPPAAVAALGGDGAQ